jgi:hypothetical protein
MVLLGLVLIALGALAIVTAFFSADIHGDHIRLLGGLDVSPLVLFLIGLAAGLAILWGFSIFKWGTKRSWAKRREQKRLSKLADSVQSVESSRRDEVDKDVADAEREEGRTG